MSTTDFARCALVLSALSLNVSAQVQRGEAPGERATSAPEAVGSIVSKPLSS